MFMKNIMENLQLIKVDKIKKTIIKNKTFLICNPSKIKDEFTLIPKLPFEMMDNSAKNLLENNFNTKFYFEEIIKSLEIISKSIGEKCSGHKKYLKILKKKINLESFITHLNSKKIDLENKNNNNIEQKKFKFSKQNMRKLFTEFDIYLRKYNFEKFGLTLAKILNIVIEFTNLNNKITT